MSRQQAPKTASAALVHAGVPGERRPLVAMTNVLFYGIR